MIQKHNGKNNIQNNNKSSKEEEMDLCRETRLELRANRS